MVAFMPRGRWLVDRSVMVAVLPFSVVTGMATETTVPSAGTVVWGIVPNVMTDCVGGGATIFRVRGAVWVRPPLLAAMMVKEPDTEVVAAVTRREAVPDALTVGPAGKVAVTPAGSPVAARVTVWVKP